MYSSYYLHEQVGKSYRGDVSVSSVSGRQLIQALEFWWFPIASPGPPISLIFNLLEPKEYNPGSSVSLQDAMSDRTSTVPPTPPSSNAADTQDGFRQLIQHNSSFQHHPNSFEGSTQMSPGGSPVQGLDNTLYSNGVYHYSNGQELFQHGLSPNIAVEAGYVG